MTTLFGPDESCPPRAGFSRPSLKSTGRVSPRTNTPSSQQQRIKLSRDLMLKLSAALSAANHGACIGGQTGSPPTSPASRSEAPSRPERAAHQAQAGPPSGDMDQPDAAGEPDGHCGRDCGDMRPPAGRSFDGCKLRRRRRRESPSGANELAAGAARRPAPAPLSVEDCAAESRKPPTTTTMTSSACWQHKVSRNCCHCCRFKLALLGNCNWRPRQRRQQQQQQQQLGVGRKRRRREAAFGLLSVKWARSLGPFGATCHRKQRRAGHKCNMSANLDPRSVVPRTAGARMAGALEPRVRARVEPNQCSQVMADACLRRAPVTGPVSGASCATEDRSHLAGEAASGSSIDSDSNSEPDLSSVSAGRQTGNCEQISSSKTTSTSEPLSQSSRKIRRNISAISPIIERGKRRRQQQQQQHDHKHAIFTCESNSNKGQQEAHKSSVISAPSHSSSSSSLWPSKRAANQPIREQSANDNDDHNNNNNTITSSIGVPGGRRKTKERARAKAKQSWSPRQRRDTPSGGVTCQVGVARLARHEKPAGPRRQSRHLLPTLMVASIVCLLSGGCLALLAEAAASGSGETGHEPGADTPELGPGQSASTSDEFSRAVLATMSTQAPGNLLPDYANESSSSGGGINLGLAISPARQFAANSQLLADNPTILDRFLDFGRIFIMSAIIVGDICGNSLVILSVCRHTKLRVTTNWFVVSLACADILVALFAMTFNASVIISGRWLFKRWVCDFWNSCDVLASTASILHLCCISIDRYIAIMRPLDYPMKITTRRVMYALCGVWISSALLSYIPIFTGIYTTAEHIEWLRENPDQCDFVVNRVYAIVSSSISFWIPCCIMVFTYYRIYREATRQEKFIYNAQKIMPAPQPNHHHHHSSGSNSASKSNAAAHKRRSKSVAATSALAGSDQQAKIRHLAKQQLEQQQQQQQQQRRVVATTELNSAHSLAPVGPGERTGSLQQLPLETEPLAATDLNNNTSGSNNGNGNGNSASKQVGVAFAKAAPGKQLQGPVAATTDDDYDEPDEPDSNSGQSTPTKRSISKMKREHKAAKTLGIIMGVFILCWLPFFSWYTPQHICGHACDGMVPGWAVTILFWIGYFNSTLNPIIYAYFNHEFRDAFKKTLQWIFCCCQDLKCLRVNRPNDNQHYNCTYRSTQEIGLVSNG